ncbi:ClpXP protease specificity-enhancing factor SspB [Acidiphilium sp. PA]|uniref:SspB family protein n=1 Tax=Acidiphilium sp. PA TaxID=2871705 RepID=UPI0022434845|nr:ClpXP protease specificity-enhancing factor SspB [Acidiphilium sp. PA]MCW8306387.1 ClpXP protease specificity-enhancing factor SspB [Acidiphilium sp. PA]
MAEDDTPIPDSLLPYDVWTEEALRLVAVRALQHAAREGLPGGHHFYVTFDTRHQGVVMPDRLRAQYPEEMTIVLQHQYRDLAVDEAERWFSVKLSFGGVPSTLQIPFAAVTAFADPEVRFGLQFALRGEPDIANQAPEPEPAAEPAPPVETGPAEVVSLDAFRRRPPAKD